MELNQIFTPKDQNFQNVAGGVRVAHRCTIFLCHLDLEILMIDIDIQISISERSSGWATNYCNIEVII